VDVGGRVRSGGERVDLGDVAGEASGGVEGVGGLLDGLAARPVAAQPPGGRWDLVQPEALDKAGRAVGQAAARSKMSSQRQW
jgi:hypothetical protein